MLMSVALIIFVYGCAANEEAAAQQARRGMSPADTLRVAEVADAQLSPDGEWVAYVVTRNDGGERRSSLHFARTALYYSTGRRDFAFGSLPTEQLTPPDMSASSPRWSPDSRRLAFNGTRGQQSGVWVLTVGERTTPARLVARVREANFFIPYAGESFAWSPDGRRIAYISASEEQEDARRAGDGRDDPRVVERIQYKTRTGFSDDARTHVWLADVDDPAQPPRQLTFGQFYDHALTWSPRGDEVAFLSNREPDPEAVNNSDIFVVGVGDGRVRRLTETRGCEYEPRWSPDGRWIAHTATTRDVTTIDSISEDAHVWIVDAVSTGGRRELGATIDRRARSPRWSPDSRHIFFLAGDRGRTLIVRVAIDGTPPSVLFDNLNRRTSQSEAQAALNWPVRAFQITSFSISTRTVPAFAFTLTDTLHPAEVWLGEASGASMRRVSAHNDALLRSVALVEPEEFNFRSFDGTNVQAWLMRPVGMRVSSGQRQPVVLSIHGGPHGMYGFGFDANFQAYAARGYAVLYMNPRGSSGYGQKFSDGTFREWGGGDYRDLMAGVEEALSRYSWIDPERMAVTGGSYGGFMTNWIITQTPRFRAAVARASVSNLVSFYATSLYQDLIHAEFGGMPWDDYELLWRWSPLRYVRDARTPTLFIHGELDNDVHITQAEEMYTALRRRGVEAVLVRYPREGHSLREPRHRQDALERTLGWFDKYLKER
jgi:dipeptidyl aminopeptidase/acylaminoacyl peptidase